MTSTVLAWVLEVSPSPRESHAELCVPTWAADNTIISFSRQGDSSVH